MNRETQQLDVLQKKLQTDFVQLKFYLVRIDKLFLLFSYFKVNYSVNLSGLGLIRYLVAVDL
jgi:hypothetical protein